MADDVAKLADKLNENMAHAVMNAWKGGINCDVPTATQKAIAKRGLATWDEYSGADLTPLGLQVQEYLLAKAEEEQIAASKARVAAMEAERKIREEGYAAGQSQMLAYCVTQLLQAVYPGDSKPDRPNDTIFDTLVRDVGKYLEGRRVTATQVELVTRQYYDVTETGYLDDKPPNVQAGYIEVMRKAMVNAGISVVSAAQPLSMHATSPSLDLSSRPEGDEW